MPTIQLGDPERPFRGDAASVQRIARGMLPAVEWLRIAGEQSAEHDLLGPRSYSHLGESKVLHGRGESSTLSLDVVSHMPLCAIDYVVASDAFREVSAEAVRYRGILAHSLRASGPSVIDESVREWCKRVPSVLAEAAFLGGITEISVDARHATSLIRYFWDRRTRSLGSLANATAQLVPREQWTGLADRRLKGSMQADAPSVLSAVATMIFGDSGGLDDRELAWLWNVLMRGPVCDLAYGLFVSAGRLGASGAISLVEGSSVLLQSRLHEWAQTADGDDVLQWLCDVAQTLVICDANLLWWPQWIRSGCGIRVLLASVVGLLLDGELEDFVRGYGARALAEVREHASLKVGSPIINEIRRDILEEVPIASIINSRLQ